MTRSLLNESITNAYRLIKTNQISSEELTRQCLERVAKIRSLNAFITVCDQQAIECARQSDQRHSTGQTLHNLDGIPIAVKDNFCTKNIRTTCASKILDNYVPPFDATVVEKLKGEGINNEREKVFASNNLLLSSPQKQAPL